jgi:hypothetical protein
MGEENKVSDKIKDKLIVWLMGVMIARLQDEDLKKWVDWALDLVEEKVKESPNKYDDMIVLPICKLARATFDIPDND